MSATIEFRGSPGLEAMAPDATFEHPVPHAAATGSRWRSATRSVGLGAVGFAVLLAVWALVSAWKPAVPSPWRRQPLRMAGRQPGDPAPPAGVAAGVVPDLPDDVPQRSAGGDVDDLHDVGVAHRHRHGGGGLVGADRSAERRPGVQVLEAVVPAARARPPHAAVDRHRLRLSMGIAWMVIVAVEMLSGGVGLILDAVFLRLGKLVAPTEVRS